MLENELRRRRRRRRRCGQRDQRTDTFYVYFVRKSREPVPFARDIEQANSILPLYFIIGSISADLLQNADILLDSVRLSYTTCITYVVFGSSTHRGRWMRMCGHFQIYVPAFEKASRTTTCSEEEKLQHSNESVTLDRRRSYYFIRRRVENYHIADHELSVTVDSKLIGQIVNCIRPDEKRKYNRLLHQLIESNNFVKWCVCRVQTRRYYNRI